MDQEKIWEFFQNDDLIGKFAFHSDSRHRFLAKHIVRNTKVLNIGVGRAGLESILVAKGVEICSLDPSSASIESLRSNFKFGERARVGYSQDIPFEDSSFDVVVMSEVLEHLSDEILQASIKECFRVLRPSGVFMGTVPAEERLADSMIVCPCCGKIFHRWGHVQEFTSERLRSYLDKEFSQCTIVRKYFGNWDELNWKGKLTHIVRRTLLHLGVRGSNENFYFTARKTGPHLQ